MQSQLNIRSLQPLVICSAFVIFVSKRLWQTSMKCNCNTSMACCLSVVKLKVQLQRHAIELQIHGRAQEWNVYHPASAETYGFGLKDFTSKPTETVVMVSMQKGQRAQFHGSSWILRSQNSLHLTQRSLVTRPVYMRCLVSLNWLST